MDRRRVRPATCASGWDLGRRRDIRRLIGAGICVFRRRRAGNGSIVRQGEILGVRIATIIKHSAMNDGAKMVRRRGIGVLMRGVQEHRRIQESPRVSGDGIRRRKYSSAFSMNLGPCNHRMKFDDLGMKLEPQRTRVQGNKEIERKWLAAAALSVTLIGSGDLSGHGLGTPLTCPSPTGAEGARLFGVFSEGPMEGTARAGTRDTLRSCQMCLNATHTSEHTAESFVGAQRVPNVPGHVGGSLCPSPWRHLGTTIGTKLKTPNTRESNLDLPVSLETEVRTICIERESGTKCLQYFGASLYATPATQTSKFNLTPELLTTNEKQTDVPMEFWMF
ncbi:hypothetical protein B0H10DRAFT_2192068 [Mycena sp. CBHHK59/15]|nr:hypothetical protein B0H10DRAFT_2192068 [Mycena sp. CBHHK59/15]